MSSYITTTFRGQQHTPSLNLSIEELKPTRISHNLFEELRSQLDPDSLRYDMKPVRAHFDAQFGRAEKVLKRFRELIIRSR